MLMPDQLCKAMSDRTRLSCLLLLQREGQLCVCELVEALEQSQPLVSRHLRQLRDLGLVEDERRGQWVHYRLSPALPRWVGEILQVAGKAPGMADAMHAALNRLGDMNERPSLSCNPARPAPTTACRDSQAQ